MFYQRDLIPFEITLLETKQNKNSQDPELQLHVQVKRYKMNSYWPEISRIAQGVS